MSQNTDPFPTPRGALSPDGVTAAVPERQERVLDDIWANEGGVSVRNATGIAALRNALSEIIAALRAAQEAEARAAAPPDIDALRAMIDSLVAGFDSAAITWKRHAAEARRTGSLSSMSGEDGIPSHVIATARAMTWEAAAEDVRLRLDSLDASHHRLASPDATRREPSGE